MSSTTIARTLTLATPSGTVKVEVTERGQGHPFLLLHGGAGPQSVAGFADLLAGTEHARVITPTHPGFDGTHRPETLHSIRALADVYLHLLDELDLADVTVVGNSIGGWMAAEMAVLGCERLSSVVLVDAVGLRIDEHPIVDFFSLTMDQITNLSYYRPEKFRTDLAALPQSRQAAMASNRAALAAYGGTSMADARLRERLSTIDIPTLVVWGAADRIVPPEHSHAYADAIPDATLELIDDAGHLPQLETPEKLGRLVWHFADTHATHHPAGA